MTYQDGYEYGYARIPPPPDLAAIAAHSKAWYTVRGIKVAERWATRDEIALEWIRQAQEAGYDVGMPRDKGGKRGNR